MPAPLLTAIVGLPALLLGIFTTIKGLALLAVATVGFKYLVLAGTFGLFVFAITALISSITGLIDSILIALPSQITVAASWVIPPNVGAIIAFTISGHLAFWIFERYLKLIDIQQRL